VTTPAPPPTLNVADAAKYVQLSIWWLKQARRKGTGPAYIRIGKVIRYRREDLDAWLKTHRVETRESRVS
jgi:predicted DNA-binding transcriptional regulator AlpA